MRTIEIPGHPHPKPGEVPLEEIRDVLGDCHRCPLADTRDRIVFGEGDPHARVMLVGEAPGRIDDLRGEPFAGADGGALDSLLAFAELAREDVYVADIVKCRPPGTREPQSYEVEACAPFLREQTHSVWPDVIVCLGAFATRFILRTDRGVEDMRGRFHRAGHFAVLPVYHPAAAIYSHDKRKALEGDFALLGRWLAEHPGKDA